MSKSPRCKYRMANKLRCRHRVANEKYGKICGHHYQMTRQWVAMPFVWPNQTAA